MNRAFYVVAEKEVRNKKNVGFQKKATTIKNQKTTPLCWYGIDCDVRRVKKLGAMGKLKCLV